MIQNTVCTLNTRDVIKAEKGKGSADQILTVVSCDNNATCSARLFQSRSLLSIQ